MRAMNAMARVLMAHSQMREAEQWYLRALELASSRQDGRWLGGFAGSKGILTGAEPDFDAAARLLFVHRALHGDSSVELPGAIVGGAATAG